MSAERTPRVRRSSLGARRGKVQWGGLRLVDGFRHEAEYTDRLEAQRRFYDLAKEAQRIAAGAAGQHDWEAPKAKVQLGPCYERSFPVPHLTVHAAIGLSAYLEYRAHAGEGVLDSLTMKELDRASYKTRLLRYEVFEKVCQTIAGLLERRLQFHILERETGLLSVTIYRLYLASHSHRLDTVEGIARAVLLYGDVLPDGKAIGRLHPSAWIVYRRLKQATQYLESRLSRDATEDGTPVELIEVVEASLPHLFGAIADLWPRQPLWSDEESVPIDEADVLLGLPSDDLSEGLAADGEFSPPMIEAAVQSPETPSDESVLSDLRKALGEAVGQQPEWEDVRSDMLADELLSTAFEPGPLEEQPISGHRVDINFGGHELSAEVFDGAVPLSNDLVRHEDLLADARTFEALLGRLLYLNPEDTSAFEARQTGGTLDPARLVLSSATDAVFRRARRFTRPADGAAVLSIICDMSGSMNACRTKLLQVLAMAWVHSAAGRKVRVLAAAYNQQKIRSGTVGNRVHWMVHPEKVPGSSFETTRAIASLSETGSGGQADAASIHHIVSESLRIARGARVYTILISDTGWIASFPGSGLRPEEEIALGLLDLATKHPGQLHTTLVALDQKRVLGLDHAVDDVLFVETNDEERYAEVAEEIALHVAQRMLKDRKLEMELACGTTTPLGVAS